MPKIFESIHDEDPDARTPKVLVSASLISPLLSARTAAAYAVNLAAPLAKFAEALGYAIDLWVSCS